MHADGINKSFATWRLPLAAVIATAMVSYLAGSRTPEVACEVEYVVQVVAPATAPTTRSVERLIGLPEVNIAIEPTRESTAIRLTYRGTDTSVRPKLRTAAYRVADLYRPTTGDAQQRADCVYAIDQQLADLANKPSTYDTSHREVNRESLLATRSQLLAINGDEVSAAPKVTCLRSIRRASRDWLAVGVPAMLFTILFAAGYRLFAATHDQTDNEPWRVASTLAMPTRTVSVVPSQAA